MKNIIIITFTLFLAASFAYASDEMTPPDSTVENGKKTLYDISIIFGTVTEDNAIASSSEPSSFCSVYSGKTLTEGTVVLISGVRACESDYPKENVPFYEILINGKPYFIQQSKVKLTETDKKRLDSMPDEVVSDFKGKSMAVSLYARKKQLDAAFKAIEKTSKYGLTLLTHKIYKTNEYTEGTGFSVSVANPTKKTIKYVTFTIIGYNSVNDPVSSGFKRGTSINVKGVGPIRPESSASYDWEYMWFTDLVPLII